MRDAEQALTEWQARQRLQRAINSRAQRRYHYRPGDLVYFWRKQVKSGQGGKHGAFLGPARILCTETRQDSDGQLRPGSAIWCVRGRRLLKCSPEQLRPASHREELLEHLAQDPEDKAPWTFPRITRELGGNEYEDISEEQPDLPEWHRAQDVTQQVPVPRHRHHIKRPVGPARGTLPKYPGHRERTWTWKRMLHQTVAGGMRSLTSTRTLQQKENISGKSLKQA